jgi:glycosyltransferase involved in cell wall biosynthesis
MENRKKVLIIVFSNLRHDARVRRQTEFLSENYETTVVCFDGDAPEGVRLIKIIQTPLTLFRKMISGLLLLLGFYRAGHRVIHGYGYLVDTFRNESFDLVIANDVETLPLAFKLSRGARVLFDAHEYAPRHFEDRLWWRIFFKRLNVFLCKTYIPQLAGMMTIGEGLAQEYERNFGIRPVVVTNATQYHDFQPSPVQPDRIRLVYHGIANPSRRLDLMIEMMRHLDNRFTLDLILMTSNFASSRTRDHIARLQQSAQQDPRIKLLPQLPSHEIVPFIHQYDVGVFLLPPVNFNYANTLPNKLFEYIQARLAVAVGPTPEMAAIVRKYGNGVVADDFTPANLAAKLNSLSVESLTAMKVRSGEAAKDHNAEKNKTILLQTVEKIIGQT